MPRKQHEVVVAQAPRKKLVSISKDQNTVIASGGAEEIIIYSPSNTVSKVVATLLYAEAMPTATSGTHRIYVTHQNGVGGNITQGTSSSTSHVQFNSSRWILANSISEPNDPVAQGEAMRSIHFDDVVGIKVNYTNSSNVNQNALRQYRFIVVEEELA
jgi:hypothetical protein